MKKIYTTPIAVILTGFLGTMIVSAGNPTFVGSVTGSGPTSTSIEAGSRASTYRYNQDNNDKEISNDDDQDREKSKEVEDKNNSDKEGDVNTSLNFEIDRDLVKKYGTTSAFLAQDFLLVRSPDDLKMYVYYLVDKNVDVDNVSIKSDRVSMTRSVPVQLFWFVPSTIKETATIISFGNGTEQVLVSRPWWSFFSQGKFTTSDISGDIEARIKSAPSGEFIAILSSATKAVMLSKIHESFLLTSSSSLIIK